MNRYLRFVIVLFFGCFGVHKFIEKKTGMGLLYLFTVGLFGFGWFYDIIISFIDLFKKDDTSSDSNHTVTIKHVSSPSKTYVRDCENAYITHKTHRKPKDYIVLDTETTGLNYKEDRVIEIGAIKYHNYKEVDRFNYLINPGFNISNKISNLTGITNEDLEGKPYIEDVLPELIQWAENYVIIAYNASFDIKMLAYECDRIGIPSMDNEVLDALFLARSAFELDNYKLETVKNALELDYIPSHRAINDCLVTNAVYIAYKNSLNKSKRPII